MWYPHYSADLIENLTGNIYTCDDYVSGIVSPVHNSGLVAGDDKIFFGFNDSVNDWLETSSIRLVSQER